MTKLELSPFRRHHLTSLLEGYEHAPIPLDLHIARYFKANRALGSKDRKAIGDAIYTLFRWKGLVEHLCEKSASWEEKIDSLDQIETASQDKSLPPHIRCSFPKVLFDLLEKQYGKEEAVKLCQVLNTKAPTTVRANPLKISRDDLLKKWQKPFDVIPCQESEHGITFQKKINLFGLDEFKAGFFEVQDEGSQLLADLVDIKPKDHFLDFCAGSGGKTLALAHKTKGKGQIYISDIRDYILNEAKRRCKRAGIENVQFLDKKKLKRPVLREKMDWILCDVPCTGTGTYRRNPDQKWKFSLDMVDRLVKTQREIVEDVMPLLKPGGYLVYGTCSLLKEENEEQIAFLTENLPLTQVKEPLKLLPKKDGHDGFFGCVLQKKDQSLR